MDDVLKFDDPTITEAFTRPIVPRSVDKLFNFLQDNQNLITVAGGMGHHATGLDRYKLAEVGKGYGIDIYRWMFAIKIFEDGILARHNEKDK